MSISISESLSERIRLGLLSAGYNLNKTHALANAIERLSDFYIMNPGKLTPWHESFALPATMAYFTPLNTARLRCVLKEFQRFHSGIEIEQIFDFGSGIGALHWAAEDWFELPSTSITCIESAATARELHRRLAATRPCRHKLEWVDSGPKNIPRSSLGVFCYSFLEIQPNVKMLEAFDYLILLEPSTQSQARALMSLRPEFLKAGYQIIAPCTHSQECPLLAESKRDWSHTRVPFHAPDWFKTIETHLPMRNDTLTYSYLILSRSPALKLSKNSARVIGDTLNERGKTRQLVCRGSKREFLSWLHRDGEPPRIPNGFLFEELPEFEIKGNELRIKKN